MRTVFRRPSAGEDIAEHWDWLAENDLDAADRWLDRLDVAFQLWASQPLMGRPRPELLANLRSFAFERHVVFYLPLPGGIEVVRVLHAARDLGPAFQSPNV